MNCRRRKRIAVLVAGMHRSGTSALVRVLNIAGCDLPNTLMSPECDNVTGFWESQAIMDLNQEILASAGSFWDDWRPFDQDWYASPVADEFRERAQELVQNEFGSSRLFVLKDPRMCRLLEFWIEILSALGTQPLVVSPIRNPFDVASSLHARNCIDPFVGHLIWLRHVLDAEAASRSLKRAYLRYEQLLSEAQALIDRLGSDLGVSWPRRSSPHADIEIDEFLSPALQHHSSEDPVHRSNPRLSDWIKTSFDIFDRWSHGEVRKEDVPELDRIRKAFDEATPAFSRAVAAGQEAERRSRDLSIALEASRHDVAEVEVRIASLEKELENSQRAAAERKSTIQNLSGELETSQRVVAGQKDTIENFSRKLESSQRVAAEQKDTIASLSGELETSQRVVAGQKDTIENFSRKLESSQRVAAEQEDTIASLSGELETSRRVVAGQRDTIENFSRKLESSQRVAAEQEDTIASLSGELESSRRVATERQDMTRSLSDRLDNSRRTAAERKSTIESLSGRLDNSRRVAAERKNATWSLSGKLESSRQVAAERKSTIESLSGRLDNSRRVAAERKNAIRSLSDKLESFRRTAAERKRTIESLSGRLDNSRRVAAERKNAIRSLSGKLESSRRTAAERKSTIESLSGRLESSRRVAVERKNAIRSLSDKLESSRRTAAERKDAIERLSNELEISRTGHVMALAHRRFRFGTDELEVNLLLNPEWIDQARQWRDREPILELRRNGRIVARAYRRDLLHSLVRIAASTRIPAAGDALYSFHDISTGKALAALSAPAFWQARRVIGAVESRPRPEVFGWVLDPSNPERGRRIAVHVDRRLHEVIDAQRQRVEPGRGKERTGGRHEFRWPIPKGLAAKDGARIDVFDADTGRPLRGSPAHLEGGQVVVSG